MQVNSNIVFHVIIIDVTLAKVVSEPPARYVLEGGPATLKCHYANEDGVFQNYIINAQWYRYFPNGSSDLIGDNGPVSMHMYSLIFYPIVRVVDQGNYYCCAPGGGCSALSLVTIAGILYQEPISATRRLVALTSS